MQGDKKPARNYLGKQKTVSNVPVKWKSGPDAPETELAYITKAEKDLLSSWGSIYLFFTQCDPTPPGFAVQRR